MTNKQKLQLKETDVAWLARLFEGEANFGIDDRSSKRYKNSKSPPIPYVKIAMVDEDVIAKVALLLNKNYFSPKRLTSKKKVVFICHIGDRFTLKQLLPRILPYMGHRRIKKIKMCINLLNQ